MAELNSIVTHLDLYLRTAEIADYAGAWNGLQIENAGTVKRIGAAVDASARTIDRAVEQGIDLLLVHHGLFWNGVQPITGATRRKIKSALDGDLAIYSSHLPLDIHPVVGNNAILARALGFKKTSPFFLSKGQSIGLKTEVRISIRELAQRLERVMGKAAHLAPGGSDITTRIGLVTGGAGDGVAQARAEGVDTFITGEGPHHSYTLAEDLGMNLFYAGHYATEIFGVQALAASLAKKFRIPWQFIDHPTGL